MVVRRSWATASLGVAVAGILLLFAQYFLGLWTNVYAPAAFTSNTSFPSLDWHYNIGFILFFVGIALVVVTALSREWRMVLGGVVVLLAIYAAGSLGGAYVSSTPNNPIDSFGMGAMFLVALLAALSVALLAWRARRAAGASPSVVSPRPEAA